jgi:murein DD-endopeptidase MepM/ murein hydrolase activator NlpD
VRKLRGTRAALLALILGLLWTSLSEAKTSHKSARRVGQPQARKGEKHPNQPRHTLKRTGKKASGLAAAAASHRSQKRRATRIIRQDTDNQVVLDWIQAVRPPRFYGPFLPHSEAYDFPPAPCQPVDVILEAHVHDESAEAPEAQAAEAGLGTEEAASRQSRIASLVAAAKRISFFLRPKSTSARVSADDVDLGDLLSANLRIPVEGVDAERLRDSFLDRRGSYSKHLAIDIGAPRGTAVVATTDGEITRLRREKRGGITIYQKDASGKYLFFYCHLARYAAGLSVGQQVSAGDVIGYVGSTGHVIGGPHLHFSITRVPEDDDFREGLAINPYLLFLAGVP